MSADRLWIALLGERPAGADGVARVSGLDGAPAGWLAAWTTAAKPLRGARRADPRILDPQGPAALISLVLPPRESFVPFDDLAVQQARRRVLSDPCPADLVTTLLVDDSHFAGPLTARRGPGAAERLGHDPFARLDTARRLRVDAGLLGRVAAPPGPVIERHGSAVPWPGGRF